MTQDQNQPPEAPTDAAEAAPSSEPAPFTAHLFMAEHPLRTRRPRRFWHLTARDWGAVIWLLLVGTAGLQLLRDQVQQMRPEARPIGEGLLLALATIIGASLVYTILRRALLDQGNLTDSLAVLARQQITESRDLLSAVRDWVAGAYEIGQQEGRADYAALLATADAAQARVDELEQQLADPRLASAARLTHLRGELDYLRNSMANLDRKSEDLPAQMAELDRRIDAVHAEHEEIREQQEHILQSRTKPDATDQQILDLLTADPGLTDDEIGRHPKVALERSQVTRRRNRLAAAGYAAAQKRQGQRKGAR